jgi:glycosyltransferase involved in cell wall biosynthesis
VLSTHNVESQRFARELELTPFWSLRHLVLGVDARLFPRWEERALQAFDGAVAVSSEDQAWLRARFGGRPVALAPNGVDTAAFAPERGPASRRRAIVFTGVMDYPPNEDAVVWFAERVWPELRRASPDLEFQVVGTRPTARVSALASQAGIRVTGEVPDVRPYVAGALAFVVPLRSGGGTRLKILQAMAMGCPVISTRLGAEGLDVEDGQHLLFAEGPGDFVARLDAIASSAERAEQLARNARQRVVERYDWSRCLEPLDELYRQVLR